MFETMCTPSPSHVEFLPENMANIYICMHICKQVGVSALSGIQLNHIHMAKNHKFPDECNTIRYHYIQVMKYNNFLKYNECV